MLPINDLSPKARAVLLHALELGLKIERVGTGRAWRIHGRGVDILCADLEFLQRRELYAAIQDSPG